MNLFKYAALSLRISYYEWALTQMCASHPDVPAITVHLIYLNDQRDQLTSNWSNA